MDQPTYSFVYDRKTADQGFHGIGVTKLVLSLLAGIRPFQTWENCLVYEGQSPHGAATVCIGMQGPGADTLQLQLVEAFENQGVQVIEVYEGGPPPTNEIAVAVNGTWSEPSV